MLNQDVYVPIPVTGLQAVEDIAEILAKIVFNSFAGLGLLASGSGLSHAEFLQPGRLAEPLTVPPAAPFDQHLAPPADARAVEG